MEGGSSTKVFMLDFAVPKHRKLLACLCFAAPLLLAFSMSCAPHATKVRVVLLGFDGANWATMDPLIESGKLPLFAELKQDAAWAPLTTFKPTKSPVIWTTIATGKPMEKHGILDFVFIEKNDLQVPYSNSERREPSIWQILTGFGLRSVIVNWFVTYPPDAIEGVMVSNRFRKTLLVNDERRRGMADTVHPPHYFDDLLSFLELDGGAVRAARDLPDLAALHESLHAESDAGSVPVLKDYDIYVLQESLNERIAHHLFETEEFDFFAAYFRLPDIVQHMALRLVEPDAVDEVLHALKTGTLSDAEERAFYERLSLLLEPFYRYMERIVASYVNAPGHENTYFVIVSDHGFTLHSGGYDHYHIPDTLPAPDGVFVMKGPKVRPGRAPDAGVYDIAPTILHLLDLPSGADMSGAPLSAALDLDREVRHERYTRELMDPKEHRRDSEIDKRTIEELRSLGYIQ